MTSEKINELKQQFEESESVWFLVNFQYKILQYNKKAARNSIAFHNKEISTGASILDYARDAKNEIDSEFIRCFGEAARGEVVEKEQEITYNSATIRTRSVYTPVYNDQKISGISILVDDITEQNSPSQ